MGSKSSSKKRGRAGVFDAVDALETQDAQAERKRRASGTRARDVQRSQAAQSQTEIYSSLVACRILLQRSIVASAQQEEAVEVSSNSNDDCNELLAKLLHARQTLTQPVSLTTSDDAATDACDYEELVKNGNEAKLEEQLQTEYDGHREEWKEVLDRRHKDVRLHSGVTTSKTQFRVMDSSFWQQVESTVQHEELRQQSERKSSFFDDSKVYQHLLKDFVSQSGNAQAAAQQRLTKQKSSGGSKKALVDRRASKGRKIRYTDIPKLQNFTFPLSRKSANGPSSDLDEDAWFRSLFGGAGSAKE